MKRNVGGTDRTARLVVGSLLTLAGIAGYAGFLPVAVGPLPQALTSLALIVVGVILLATSATQKCPINAALGVDTCERQ